MQPTISYSRDPTICDVSALFHVPGFWICKIAKLLYWYAELANTAWMFCEALFLRYQILANVFSDLNLLQFYLIGWIAPIGLALPLFVLTYIDNNNFKMKAMDELLNGTITIVEYQMTMPQTICMSQTSNSYSTYFLTGPIICCLFLNMIILITIIKTVVSKLRASTDKFTMKALKATCLLMPLLGAVQFIAIYNPFFEKKNTADGLWHILNITIKSSLGTLVCVCYCFTNSEVQRTLKRQYGAKMENIKPSKSVYSNFSRSCTERSTQNTEAESISMIDNSNNQNGSNNTRSPSKFSQMQSGSVYSNRLGKNGSYHNSSVTSSGGYKGPNIGNPKKLSVNKNSQNSSYRADSTIIKYKDSSSEKDKFISKKADTEVKISDPTNISDSIHKYETTVNRKVSQSDSPEKNAPPDSPDINSDKNKSADI